jgi:hypothetical protein
MSGAHFPAWEQPELFSTRYEQHSDHCANRREMNGAHDVRPSQTSLNMFVTINLVHVGPTTKEIDQWIQSRSPKKSTSRAGVFLALQP